MPDVMDGESEKEFIARCIEMVMEDGTASDNDKAAAVCYSMWEEHMKADDGSETAKYGNRNSVTDRKRIREARQHARAIHDITMELEPHESDDEMAQLMEDVQEAIAGGKALRVKILAAKHGETKRQADPEAVKRLKAFEEYTDPGWNVLGVPFGGPHKGRDADGEAFHEETNIWLDAGAIVPITYYHGV